MLCKLTNTGPSVRVLYDINHVERTILPGRSLEVDLNQKAAKKYAEANAKGGVIAIQALEEGDEIAVGEAERADDPKETFTLREGEGTHPEMKEPQTIKEARGFAGNQPPPYVAAAQAAAANHPDPIANAAEQAAKEPVEPEVKPEPTTAGELLGRLAEYNDTDQVRLANAVLPKKLQLSAKPAQIIAALKAQAKKDAEPK
jgi:hypothetical protein